jgi:hypothetical protein
VNATQRPVIGPGGLYGSVNTTCWPGRDKQPEAEVFLRLPDGRHRTIPAYLLIEQKDGSFYIPLKREELEHCPEPAIVPGAAGEATWPCSSTLGVCNAPARGN